MSESFVATIVSKDYRERGAQAVSQHHGAPKAILFFETMTFELCIFIKNIFIQIFITVSTCFGTIDLMLDVI